MDKPKVVTLCGSTKFKEEFMQWQKLLTLMGHIIISVGLFGHADGEYGVTIDDSVKEMLDELHLRKIDLSDGIFVIDKDGYIGESTKREIAYAEKTDKPVAYMSRYILNISGGNLL
jgi:hypothetical protein